jgi:hypothetical protein
VTKEEVEAGSKTYTFAYTTSAHANAYNNWKTKTVETLPSGAQNIVYTNYIGQALISEFKSGTSRWIEHRQYDSEGRETLRVTPSGVTGYDDTQANLAVTLRASDGLFHVTDYYTTTGSGAAKGYVQHEKIKKGSSWIQSTRKHWAWSRRYVPEDGRRCDLADKIDLSRMPRS